MLGLPVPAPTMKTTTTDASPRTMAVSILITM